MGEEIFGICKKLTEIVAINIEDEDDFVSGRFILGFSKEFVNYLEEKNIKLVYIQKCMYTNNNRNYSPINEEPLRKIKKNIENLTNNSIHVEIIEGYYQF